MAFIFNRIILGPNRVPYRHRWAASSCVRPLSVSRTGQTLYAPLVVQGDARAPASYEQLSEALNRDGNIGHRTIMKSSSNNMSRGGVDLMLTDPPYCILTRRSSFGQIRDPKLGGTRKRKLEGSDVVMKFDSLRSFEDFTRQWMETALPFLRTEAALVIWTNPLGRRVYYSVAQSHGYALVGEYMWAKPSDNGAVPPPLNTARNEILCLVRESALVFRRKALPPMRPSDVPLPWFVMAPNPDSDSDHPCRKPREVLEPLIRAWSKPGDWVLDPFAGSGSTLQCARALERHSYGIELNETWARRLMTDSQ
jgi:site-specific DNA-methyltransferase (adenine-specific)